VFELVTTDVAGPTDRAKQNVPLWSWTMNATYALNKLSTNLTVRYIGETLIDTTRIGPDNPAYSPTLANSANINLRPAVTYADLSAQYTLKEQGSGGKLVVYGVINNMFDREPPLGGGSNLTGAAIPLYDLTGRFARVGVRFNY
jgi:iron complex outermembrane recepter protein